MISFNHLLDEWILFEHAWLLMALETEFIPMLICFTIVHVHTNWLKFTMSQHSYKSKKRHSWGHFRLLLQRTDDTVLFPVLDQNYRYSLLPCRRSSLYIWWHTQGDFEQWRQKRSSLHLEKLTLLCWKVFYDALNLILQEKVT